MERGVGYLRSRYPWGFESPHISIFSNFKSTNHGQRQFNDFHFGKNLAVLNRAARLVPNDVKGFASLLSNVPNPTPDQVQDIVNLLDDYANDMVGGRLFKIKKS